MQMDVSLIRAKQLLQYLRKDDMSACSEDNTEALTNDGYACSDASWDFVPFCLFCFMRTRDFFIQYQIKWEYINVIEAPLLCYFNYSRQQK